MTRIEKYASLRQQITDDIKTNTIIWEQEAIIEKYRKKLIKIDDEYFSKIFQDLNKDLNLISFEKKWIKNKYEYLEENDKYALMKLLMEVNETLEQYLPLKESEITEATSLIPYNIEYKEVINTMRDKILEFQTELELKIKDVKIFVANLEKKYKNYKVSNLSIADGLKDLKKQNNSFQDEVQKLRVKSKLNHKLSLIIFSLIVVSLIMIVVLLLLLVFIK